MIEGVCERLCLEAALGELGAVSMVIRAGGRGGDG